MNPALLPLLRCPICQGYPLEASAQVLRCPRCGSGFGSGEGFADLLPAPDRELITPFQRIMQTPLVVALYENWWRRLGYRLASSRSFDAELSTILRYSELSRGWPVLDVACGPGVFTRPLARRAGGLVVGFDLSRPMLQHAVQKARSEGLANIGFVRGTVFHLPFESGVFHQVNCCGALHLFDDPSAALAELVRVLTSGGCLTIQTTIRPERSGGLALFLERRIRFGFFAEDELLQLLAKHSLDVRHTERHRISLSLVALRKI